MRVCTLLRREIVIDSDVFGVVGAEYLPFLLHCFALVSASKTSEINFSGFKGSYRSAYSLELPEDLLLQFQKNILNHIL